MMIVTFSKVDYVSVCLQLNVPGNDRPTACSVTPYKTVLSRG